MKILRKFWKEVSDDAVLVEETREDLQHNKDEFERVCDSIGLQINTGKNKVLLVKKDQRGIGRR